MRIDAKAEIRLPVQYFRLCRDSLPALAKLEISYWVMPEASNFSHAIS